LGPAPKRVRIMVSVNNGACGTGVRTMKMMISAGFLAFLASPVLAFHCPADMAAIDAALVTATLSAEDLAKVQELRALGEAEHLAGNHQASVDALAEAMKLMGI
jgi:hypothetical protein